MLKIIYITSPKNSKNPQKLDPESHNRRRWWPRNTPNLCPSARILPWVCTKEKKWFQTGSLLYLVRTIYHQPAQKLKIYFSKLKFTNAMEDRDNDRPITVATHHHRSGIIWDCEITKSFTVLLQILVIRWLSEGFMEVDAGFFGAGTMNATTITKRRGCTTTAWKGHQKASFDILYRLQQSRFVFSTDVGVARRKSVWKSCDFSTNLGGHRPPRRNNLYSTRNIH